MTLSKRHVTSNEPLIPPRGGGQGNNTRNPTKLNMMAPVNPSSIMFDSTPFNNSLLIITAANAIGFLISLATGSHVHLDLIGTGAFALASIPTLLSSPLTRVQISSAAVFTWGTKLASFLFFRALKMGHDARLDETLSTATGAFGFWFVSLLWGVICSLPHTLGTTSSDPGNPILLSTGIAMYALGLVTESLADYQKWSFKNDVANAGQFCNVGLWSVSQHPNFLGNLLMWSGILVMNIGSLIEPSSIVAVDVGEKSGILSTLWRFRRAFLAFLSPAFMFLLFSGQANGTITNAVELANKKYGHIDGYNSYVENVPLIFPKLFAWLGQLLPGK